jgi:hypothetical protein
LDYGRQNDLQSYSYLARAALAQAMTRRSNFTLAATAERAFTLRRNTVEEESELLALGITSGITRSMTRTTKASASYTFRAGIFPNATAPGLNTLQLGRAVRLIQHGVETGFGWARPLSATRRMVFDVVVGGILVQPQDQPVRGPLRLTDAYRLVGSASGSYVMGRSWQLAALYRRSIDYVPGLTEPVFTDGFVGRIEGAFTRWMQIQAAVGYSSGTSVLLRNSSAFDSYTSDVKVTVPIRHNLSVYGQYVYYLYDFRRYAPLVAGIPPALERNGLRVGLTLSVPTVEW